MKHQFFTSAQAVILTCGLSILAPAVSALPMAGNTPPILAMGVGNSPVGEAGRHADMPLGYRFQYFTGGLGADDWRKWLSPDGSFADKWLEESHQAGLTPVITYYEIVHAAPYRFEEPPSRNLQTPATMKAYFENWIFLLQRIAAFGHPVVVQVEPDLWGYIEWSNSDPAQTGVAVASSGLAQAAGYENNARGFAKLMKALRDQYAPNVILGWHVSGWATRTDLIVNQGDPDKLAVETANFYRSLDTEFDVMFTETSDRDSGFYQLQGGPDRWWKQEDFDRFRQFVSRLHSELNQDVIIWQIPVGNTLYRKCNNTPNHYQDNRPEYFLKPVVDSGDTTRLQQFRDAGVVALLFGAGQDDQTRYFDYVKDAVEDPAPIDNRARNRTDHLNDLPALNSDDDGGFLRLGIQRYYANGALPLAPRVPSQCGDGIDNDHDGLTDFPNDPQCQSPTDNNEVEPLPACTDGVDNDSDGWIDYPDDPGCSAADDGDESNGPVLTSLPSNLAISSDWGTGYCADVTVRNNKQATVLWQTGFEAAGSISNIWNANYTQTGKQVTASGDEWNKELAPGGTANFGFCADRSPAPAVCSDQLDNDGDGLADYPDDPGCSSAEDGDETDANPGQIQHSLHVDADWGSGYCATVTVNNLGVSGQQWSVDLNIAGRVDNLWNGIYGQSGILLKVKGEVWNATLAGGASTSFGFCASR
ncbi:cellulose binding domain-containing protein [Methylomonas sp. SURF-1]|uniref:Cellulose binding domain-containing protein n=1 Tax=Methylomonas aurea TaxID=2952224 RepID=A0ABT1UGE8_9GAMM|nr:cellulose binding domain-containing protein [Methylomonas sp. SURF-1]MCQ8181303.1 cellulose binding domain-containing protein [Methylomonas sp. SURF-1]